MPGLARRSNFVAHYFGPLRLFFMSIQPGRRSWHTRGLLLILGLTSSLLAAHRAQAQAATLLFDETFDDNRRGWDTSPVATVTRRLEGGAYCFRSSSGGATAMHAQGLTASRDFDLEADLRPSGGALAGLIWGADDLANGNDGVRDEYHHRYYALLLDDTGQRGGVARQLHGGLAFVQPLRALPKGGRPGSAHTLRVERRGLTMRALIDGTELWTTTATNPAELLAAPMLGFYFEGPGELRVERLRAWEYPRPLALAAPLAANLKRETLPAPVNAPGEEQQVPVVSPDGRQLYFSRGRRLNADIYVAQRQPDSTWADVRPIAELNNDNPNSIESISPDGNLALVRGSYNAEALQATAEASLTGRGADGRWQTPQPLFIQKYPRLSFSRGRVTEYCLAASGLTLILSISEDEFPSLTDLYASQRQPNGEWSRPQPLGPTLNTPYAEAAPFLAPDGLTLYFASNGHPGYGSADIFVSRRLDDTWTKWSAPLNLGPVVNTPGFDTGFSLSAAADYAYLSSNGEIQRLRLPAPARPVATVLVRGQVFDARTRLPVVADVRYERLPDGLAAGQARAALRDGAYQLALATGRQYGFRAEAEGYLSASDNLDLPDSLGLRGGTVLARDLYLLPLQPVAVTGLSASAVRLQKTALAAPAAPVALVPVAAPGAAVAGVAAGAVRVRTAPAAAPARPATLAPVRVAPAPASAAPATVVLHNIFFVQGRAVLLPSSLPELRRLRETLLAHPTMVIRLEGHTDIEGDAAPNQVLSEQRVQAVRKYLLTKPTTAADDEATIAATRIQTIGYGEARPVVPNPTSEAERRQNRRVELAILVP